jgi:hypothetical protein
MAYAGLAQPCGKRPERRRRAVSRLDDRAEAQAIPVREGFGGGAFARQEQPGPRTLFRAADDQLLSARRRVAVDHPVPVEPVEQDRARVACESAVGVAAGGVQILEDFDVGGHGIFHPRGPIDGRP